MGTEVAISFSSLRAQLENEKSNLFKIDESIKKIVQTSGRFPNDRFNSSGDYNRGGARPGGRNSYPDTGKSDDVLGKRKQETKTVFSRLSARTGDSDGEDEGPKRARMPSAVWRSLPSRAAVLRAQGGDEAARTRNRRMFGSLLGTLQKFKQEEITLQTKEEKKAQVERKIEEQARQEKERELKERKTLFAEREHKKAKIKALEAKMGRVQEFDKWEESQKSLGNFILTKTKPHLYWLPKKMNEKAEEKLTSSRKFNEKCMSRKREELQQELLRIEQRCLRARVPGAKENAPQAALHRAPQGAPHEDQDLNNKDLDPATLGLNPEESGRKRDKFAMDVDEKEESDGEEREKVEADVQPAEEAVEEPTEEAVEEPAEEAVEKPAEEAVEEPAEMAVEEPTEEDSKEYKDSEESKMDTSVEPSTIIETEATNNNTESPKPIEPEVEEARTETNQIQIETTGESNVEVDTNIPSAITVLVTH